MRHKAKLAIPAAVALASLLLPQAASGQPGRAGSNPTAVLSAVARVEAITRANANDVQIIRPGRRGRPAQVYDRIYRGDHILMAGQQTSIGLRRRTGAGVETIHAVDQSEISFDAPQAPSFSSRARRLFARLSFWYARGPVLPQIHAARSADSLQRIGPPARLSPAVGARQNIAAERTLVVVFWRGSATRVGLAGDGRLPADAAIVIGRRAVRLPVAGMAENGVVQITDDDGHTFRIGLARRPRPPRMPAWIARIVDRTERDLAMAGWLVLEGPPEWRLEGASRLAELAESDLAARSIWEAYLGSQEGPRARSGP